MQGSTPVPENPETHDPDDTLTAPSPPGSPSTTSVPTRIGRYRILEPAGEGGMGTVFVAEQNEPVRRKVALKVIKWGMDTKEVLARFEAEHHALALMNHPNIARVFDAGATDDGRPFFVMEHVPGIPLTQYCDRHRLSPRPGQIRSADPEIPPRVKLRNAFLSPGSLRHGPAVRMYLPSGVTLEERERYADLLDERR